MTKTPPNFNPGVSAANYYSRLSGDFFLEYGFRELDGSEKWGYNFDWWPMNRKEAEALAIQPGRSLIFRELRVGPTIDLWPEDEEAR